MNPNILKQNINKKIPLLFVFFSTCFMLFVIKMTRITLQEAPLVRHTPFEHKAYSILDRNGRLLASSIMTFSIYAHPESIRDKHFVSETLAPILNQTSASVLQKIDTSKSFVWLARHVSPDKKKAIESLGIEGISFHQSTKRIYPYKRLFSHIIGLRDIDQNPICGIEKALDTVAISHKDNVVTSLDVVFQNIVHQELTRQMKHFNATAANALLCDVHTGEIISIVSLPDFSPNRMQKNVSCPSFFNRNITGVYEFGSIMKAHNLALFLESKKGSLETVFDATHPISIGPFKIKDYYGKKKPLTVAEGFVYSSNIVNAKMAQACGANCQRDFFKKMNFFDPVDTILTEKAAPIAPTHKWSLDRVMTAGYGYGFAVTPLHVVKSMACLVTGKDVDLSFLKKDAPDQRPTIISDQTVQSIRLLLQQSTEKGCARKAFTSALPIGAKTGTANLRCGKNYVQGENLASCVAVFPIHDPKYVLLVSIEKPEKRAETHYRTTGGWIAAPVIKRIVERMAPLMRTP